MSAIAKALVKAQKEFGPAIKSSNNPHFKTRYAKLEVCIDAVLDALNNNGIMLTQKTSLCEDGVIVETIFLHESGEQMSSGQLHVPAAKHDPQGYGSALTYARRYSLMTACGLAPEDDDGNAATRPFREPPTTASTPAPVAKPPAPPAVMQGKKEGPWHLKVMAAPDGDTESWMTVVKDATTIALENTSSEDDVMNIFRNNKAIYDQYKAINADSYSALMLEFRNVKQKFQVKQ
jgi:hypothetical protein